MLGAISYADNTIVDVYQLSGNRVAVITFSSLYDSAAPTLYLNETIITDATLLYVVTRKSDSPVTIEFAIYSKTTKQVTLYSYNVVAPPATGVTANGNDGYLVEDWELLQTDLIHTYCSGYTLNQVYYDGNEDSSPPGDLIRIEQTANSGICGFVFDVSNVVFTEVKRVKIDHSCYSNPVYLKWKYTVGGWDQWLFQKTQTRTLTTIDLGDFQQPEYDLETSQGSNNSLGYEAGEPFILGANNLTTNQYNAIKELLYAPIVYWIQLDASKEIGYTQTKVKVKPGTFSIETKDGFHSIEFELVPPDINTVKS